MADDDISATTSAHPTHPLQRWKIGADQRRSKWMGTDCQAMHRNGWVRSAKLGFAKGQKMPAKSAHARRMLWSVAFSAVAISASPWWKILNTFALRHGR